jgi:nitrite reductase/ring-hydroxylating ferredoxin subunit
MAWTYAASVEEIGGRDILAVDCGGRRIALYQLDGGFFATSDACPHQGAPLSDGCIVDRFVECAAHFALFDIRTGAADGGPTTTSVKTFPTRVENGEIHVDVDG